MRDLLPNLIFLAGAGQLSVLIATVLVPWRLQWRTILQRLPPLQRQMYWVYGGYIVLSITAFGCISLLHARELAEGSALARSVCGYVALFWGIRLALQPVLDVREQLSAWWLKLGYGMLTMLFAGFTVVFGAAALLPGYH